MRVLHIVSKIGRQTDRQTDKMSEKHTQMHKADRQGEHNYYEKKTKTNKKLYRRKIMKTKQHSVACDH